ncbi:uncharacterized protein LOC101235453 isoform X1 [Hydra vulgaris]|uniref:uncharacterized protein LOC101235453 isoform X1 n=1 Tax=Hydra vulgaris TaxID=6087 RepID=UPI001F5FD895|nr:uncharacterized protein LOC101235453 isoform X1 [Hydra vulgaris]
MKMIIFLFFVSFISSVSGNEVSLRFKGRIMESSILPVTIRCEDYKAGYVHIGGITINYKPLNATHQQKAKLDCNEQYEKTLKEVKKKKQAHEKVQSGTICVLTLLNSEVKSNDLISIVYDCFDTKPAGAPAWGVKNKEEEEENPKEKIGENVENQIKLSCNDDKEMIFANKILNSKQISKLTPTMVSKSCLKQWKEQKELGTLKSPFSCYINKETAEDVTITYYCIASKSQQIKVKGY